MHSEVEKLLVELRAEVRNDGTLIARPTDLNLRAASLIERLYREREKLHAAIRKEAGGKGKPLFGTAFNHFANLYPETAAAILTLAEQPQ